MSTAIEWDEQAERDADEIFGWIEERSPAGAASWHEALEEAIHRVAADPGCFPVCSEGLRHKRDVREALFKTPQGRRYRLLFVIAGTRVRILRVRGPGQRPLRRREL